jgi:hypothetical protein
MLKVMSIFVFSYRQRWSQWEDQCGSWPLNTLLTFHEARMGLVKVPPQLMTTVMRKMRVAAVIVTVTKNRKRMVRE